MLNRFYELLNTPCRKTYAIFLDIQSPKVCLDRLRVRHRLGESNIDLNYMELLNRQFEICYTKFSDSIHQFLKELEN